ncbi:MAG TPA: ATP-binding cassette domain-containing protein [Gemmatimonadaceae bacterium]
MREVLVADCAAKRFDERWVLHSASLRATAGEVRALLGRNGAGKSTLLRIAAGIVRSDAGTVQFRGVWREKPALPLLAREGLCFVPDHDLLSNAFSIREHFQLAQHASQADDAARVAERLKIDKLLDAKPFELSSGERRRAEIGFAMLRRPVCLLIDEPLRNISPIDAEELLRVLVEMARAGCAVVITGHEVPALLAAADHITWCTAGTTYEMGPAFMARTDERFMRDYLGPSGF